MFFSICSSNKIYSLKLYKLIAISIPMHECFTISCVKLYYLLNSTLHSEANACFRHLFLDFICRCWWKKKTKHLPIDSKPIHTTVYGLNLHGSDIASTNLRDILQVLIIYLGGKYLVLWSSCSLKMRKLSFSQF